MCCGMLDECGPAFIRLEDRQSVEMSVIEVVHRIM